MQHERRDTMNKIEKMKRSMKKRKYKGILVNIIAFIIVIMLGSQDIINSNSSVERKVVIIMMV